MRIAIIILLLLTISYSTKQNNFRKYDIESGIITYSLKYPLKSKSIEQKVYFSDYGSTEYFEYINKEDFPTLPIFKKDSLEYTFVSDSMTISSKRSSMTVFEKLI